MRPAEVRSIGIIGATGDIGSQFANFALSQRYRVLCSIRPQSIDTLKTRVKYKGEKARIFLGDIVSLNNLSEIIRNADFLYNLSGMVGLGFCEEDYAQVLAVNGFAQGIITHLVQDLGREEAIKIVYPSSQRVHLLLDRDDAREWMEMATTEFDRQLQQLLQADDVGATLVAFAQKFIEVYPLSCDLNVYEISKRLGELFISRLKRYSIVRISSVYGPGCWPRGFLHRAIYTRIKGEKREESREQRDFIYVQDLNEILLKLVDNDDEQHRVFDGASGTSIDLEQAFSCIVAQMPHDTGTIHFKPGKRTILKPDNRAAKRILGREFTDFAEGLNKTIEYYRGRFQPHEEPAYLHALRFDQPEAYEPDADELVMPRDAGGDVGDRVPAMIWGRVPYVIVLDVGATNFRIGVMTPKGNLLNTPVTYPTPGPQQYPKADLGELQALLVEHIIRAVNEVTDRYPHIYMKHVGISFGAVVSNEGVVENASILWRRSAKGFNLKRALEEKMPSMAYTVVNDVSAAAWRYKEEERFYVITVSTGLGNKVFTMDSTNPFRIDIDRQGLGGEMGHVVVDPVAAAKAVELAQEMASQNGDIFAGSLLGKYAKNTVSNITVTFLGQAVNARDDFALRILEEAGVPYCECGNIADLCSYSSGPGTLQIVQMMARAMPDEFGKSELARHAKGSPRNITTQHIAAAAQVGDTFTLRALDKTTAYLAHRILQLSADLGLGKFIIIGGFAVGVGEPYLRALQDNLVRLCHSSGFFTEWDEGGIRGLVRLGNNDNCDGLIGMGYLVQHLQSRYKVALKPVGERRLVIAERDIPLCGTDEVLVRIKYAGLCSTDVQIYKGERPGEPGVLGHECIAEVIEVGQEVSGIRVGDVITINPNNPLDEDDKVGHTGTREGIFRQFYKFPADLISKGQITVVDRPSGPEDVLIEAFSCVVNAQEMIVEDIRGKKALVVGAGLPGLLHVMLAKAQGAQQVFLANASQARLDFAVEKRIIGREHTVLAGQDLPQWIREKTYDHGADVVIIAVSRNAGLPVVQQALTYTADGGTIFLFGGFTGRDVLQLPTGEKVICADIRRLRQKNMVNTGDKNVTFAGSRGAQQAHFQKAARLAARGDIELRRFVTHVISLEALPEVIEQLSRTRKVAGTECIRAVVDMNLTGKVILDFP